MQYPPMPVQLHSKIVVQLGDEVFIVHNWRGRKRGLKVPYSVTSGGLAPVADVLTRGASRLYVCVGARVWVRVSVRMHRYSNWRCAGLWGRRKRTSRTCGTKAQP